MKALNVTLTAIVIILALNSVNDYTHRKEPVKIKAQDIVELHARLDSVEADIASIIKITNQNASVLNEMKVVVNENVKLIDKMKSGIVSNATFIDTNYKKFQTLVGIVEKNIERIYGVQPTTYSN